VGTGDNGHVHYLSEILPYTTFFRLLLRPLIYPGVWMFPRESSCIRPNPGWLVIYFFILSRIRGFADSVVDPSTLPKQKI